jgi:hypothetical protein
VIEGWSSSHASRVNGEVADIARGFEQSRSRGQVNFRGELAAKHGLLMLYGDPGGFVGVDEKGRVFDVNGDWVATEAQEGSAAYWLALGKLKHMEGFEGLAPAKPSAVPVCPQCGGRGYIAENPRAYCSVCLGHGWINASIDVTELFGPPIDAASWTENVKTMVSKATPKN